MLLAVMATPSGVFTSCATLETKRPTVASRSLRTSSSCALPSRSSDRRRSSSTRFRSKYVGMSFRPPPSSATWLSGK
jgi:hypothetical protein